MIYKLAILFIACVAMSQAERVITTYGTCPNFVPALNAKLDDYLGKIWYEVMRSNDGEGRNEWCSQVYSTRLNSTAIFWDNVKYDALTSTVISNPLIITGCNGTFAVSGVDGGYGYKTVALSSEPDLVVSYACMEIGDNMRIDKVYVFSPMMQATCEMKRRTDAVLQRYGIANHLAATVQGIPECSQLRGPACAINVVNS